MKKERNGLYEGMYILSATLSDESRKRAFDKIVDGITQRGGEIKKIHDQGRRRLCYEIKGKREGHYYVIYFTVSTAAIIELWKEYHLHEDMVRFMTMRVEHVQETLTYPSIKMAG